mmetsp:Transcript_11397/g.29378  ORF Transcript_11397/g.29378 Transcript_11397/m.29378 type:complete len:122 (-) Transcript_11397:72-437(-)
MEGSKLDTLCDFSKQEGEGERFRKFQSAVSPECTFAVNDAWRMTPVKDIYPQRFRVMGTPTRDARERRKGTGAKNGGREGEAAPTYHVSIPRKVIEESKFRLVESNQNKHNSFSLISHVNL